MKLLLVTNKPKEIYIFIILLSFFYHHKLTHQTLTLPTVAYPSH